MMRARRRCSPLVAFTLLSSTLSLSPAWAWEAPPLTVTGPSEGSNRITVHSKVDYLDEEIEQAIYRRATQTALDYEFLDTDFIITVDWLSEEQAFGIRVQIRSPESKLQSKSGDPEGDVFDSCADCTTDQLPDLADTALKNAIDEFVVTEPPPPPKLDPPQDPAPPSAPPPRLSPAGKTGVALVVIGSAAYVAGVTLTSIFAAKGVRLNPNEELVSQENYTPGVVLLATAPIPIVVGAVLLARNRRHAASSPPPTARRIPSPKHRSFGRPLRF